jgi:hypothetical protein
MTQRLRQAGSEDGNCNQTRNNDHHNQQRRPSVTPLPIPINETLVYPVTLRTRDKLGLFVQPFSQVPPSSGLCSMLSGTPPEHVGRRAFADADARQLVLEGRATLLARHALKLLPGRRNFEDFAKDDRHNGTLKVWFRGTSRNGKQ